MIKCAVFNDSPLDTLKYNQRQADKIDDDERYFRARMEPFEPAFKNDDDVFVDDPENAAYYQYLKEYEHYVC